MRRASFAMFSAAPSAASDRRVRTHNASPLWCWCESGIKLGSRSIVLEYPAALPDTADRLPHHRLAGLAGKRLGEFRHVGHHAIDPVLVGRVGVGLRGEALGLRPFVAAG